MFYSVLYTNFSIFWLFVGDIDSLNGKGGLESQKYSSYLIFEKKIHTLLPRTKMDLDYKPSSMPRINW